METTQGIGIFPSVPEGTKIINPKYGEPSKEDYDASTVEKGKTRIIFELDGAKWDYPVVFEVENGRLFLTSERPKKEGYEFVGWDEDWKASNGGVVVYKAKWLRKEISDNNGISNTDNTNSNQNTSGNTENNSGTNTGRYKPHENTNSGNNGNAGNTSNNGTISNQYIYNGRVLTGNPNNNSVNIYNSGNTPNVPISNTEKPGIGIRINRNKRK